MIIAIPQRNYQPGQIAVRSTAVPLGASRLLLVLDRTYWTDPAIQLDCQIERSLDGGVTWTPGGRTVEIGGTSLDRDGIAIMESRMITILREPANPNRQVRAALTLTGGALKTSGRIEIT